MTDREPDDLYDALRTRLADYGQEPPAPLWANIRAQLPPPVASPQLRRRARRRALAALALLLLVGLSTWRWWPPVGRQVARGSSTPPSPAAGRPTNAAAKRMATAPANTIRRASTAAAARTERANTTPATTVAAAGAIDKAAAVAAASTTAAPVAVAPGGIAARSAAAETGVAVAASSPGVPALAGAGAARQRALATNRPTRPAGAGKAARTARQDGVAARTSPASIAPASAVARPITPAPDNPTTAVQQLPAATRAAAPSRKVIARAASRPAARATGEQEVAGTRIAMQPEAHEAQEAQAETARERPQPAATPTRAAGYLAVPRPTALQRPSEAVPVVLARADTLPPLPATRVRRWVVQALAGPGLTSRTLGSQQRYYGASPTLANNPMRNVSSSTENEQATTSFGAQAQLQQQLSGRWSLGTGLGYQAFATRQTVMVRVAYGPATTSNFLPDSVGTVSVRNSYHFLTVPLRVGYQLGSGHARLRYGLRAGADVALYLGGRSTEGSPSGSSGRNWGISGSPYRPLSLALSLGAEVRYQLAPSWELLAQPTLTHFVTSVARPAAGYGPRYPMAATALVGVAYWLR